MDGLARIHGVLSAQVDLQASIVPKAVVASFLLAHRRWQIVRRAPMRHRRWPQSRDPTPNQGRIR